MLTIEGFMAEMRRLYVGYSKKFSQETTDLYYSLSRKKLSNMQDYDFSEIVDDILVNENYFPTFAKITEYYNKINKEDTTEAVKDCHYCYGTGRVAYEKYEKLYDDYITVSCNCVCGSRAESISNISNNGVKQKIDAGEYIPDKDGVFRRPERIKFKTNSHKRAKKRVSA